MLREFQVENIEYQYSKAWFKYFVRDLLELASVIVLTYIKLFLSITLDYIVIRGIKINQLVISNINICFWIYASWHTQGGWLEKEVARLRTMFPTQWHLSTFHFCFLLFSSSFYEMCFPSICERYIISHFLLHVLRNRLRDYKIYFPWHILCVKASLYILDIQHFGSCCVLVVHNLYLLPSYISMLFARVK